MRLNRERAQVVKREIDIQKVQKDLKLNGEYKLKKMNSKL